MASDENLRVAHPEPFGQVSKNVKVNTSQGHKMILHCSE